MGRGRPCIVRAAALACGVSVVGAVLCLCEHATKSVSWTALLTPPQSLSSAVPCAAGGAN